MGSRSVLLGLAMVLAGCSSGPQIPACEPAFLDPAGSCGLGSIVGAIDLGAGGPKSVRTTVTVAGEGVQVLGDSGDGARSFSIGRVMPGAYTVIVHATGYVAQSFPEVPVVAGRSTDLGTIELLPDESWAPAIAGTVRLEGSADHQGTLVHVDDSSFLVETPPDGSFRIPGVAPGPHVLHARHPGFRPVDMEVVVPENDDLIIDLLLETIESPGSMAGLVSEIGTGAPLPGATVRVGDLLSVEAGADGRYEMTGLPAGTFEVRVGLPGFQPFVREGVKIESGRQTILDVGLARSDGVGMLVGIAKRMHAPGGGNGGISVGLVGTDVSTTTDPEGRWTLESVPPGLYDIIFDDHRFPPLIAYGIAVEAGSETAVLEVELGPALRIGQGLSSDARIFPERRKAVITLSNRRTYLFDGSRGTLDRLADEPLVAISVDRVERWVTLRGQMSLYRLDLTDGALDRIEGPSILSLVSDGALTLFVGEDQMLYSLPAGSVVPNSEFPADWWLQSEIIDEARGWRTVAGLWNGQTFQVPVDFGDPWVGPAGSQVVRESQARRVAVLGPYVERAGTRVRALDCIDFADHQAVPIAQSVVSFTSDFKSLLFREDAGATSSVGALDLSTCGPTIETGVESTVWMGSNALVARRNGGGELLWLGGSPPSSGILCSDSRGEFGESSIIGCLEGPAPHSIRVFDAGTGAPQTWSTDAAGLPLVTQDEDLPTFAWIDSGGRLHARVAGRTFELIADCPSVGSTSILPLEGDFRRALAQCADPAGSWLLDFSSRKSTYLPERTLGCAASPDGSLAVCTHPCGPDVCARVHDLVAVTSTLVAPASGMPVVQFGSEGGAAIRVGGEAFHARAGAAGAPPQVWSCGLPGAIALGAEADHSLWRSPASEAYLCSGGGALDGPVQLSTPTVQTVGKRRFAEGWLFDLEVGSSSKLLEPNRQPGAVRAYDSGLLVVGEAGGLLRVPNAGAPDWLVTGMPVAPIGEVTTKRWLAYAKGSGNEIDLILVDRLSGEVSATLPRWNESAGSSAAGFRLVVYDADAARSAGSLAVVGEDSWWPLAARVALAEGGYSMWGHRLLFNTPTDRGVAFAAADLLEESVTVLHPEFGGRAIGSLQDGSLLFVADGWTWQEAPGKPRAVLAGEATSVEAAAGEAIVFHARLPDGTYWLEEDR